MTLISVEGKKQESIGKRDYWKSFVEFKGSPLHEAFVLEIDTLLPNQKEIYSSQVGSRIISKIEKSNPQLLQKHDPSIVGNHFGMTLWNHLADHHDTWHFYKESSDIDDGPKGMIYFRSSK